MPFVKLDCGILNSSLWPERDCRDLFITALLMAQPHELRAKTPQLYVDKLDETGWFIPPGWYGFAETSGIGMIRLTGLSKKIGMKALELLCSPDQESRSKEFDGRRLARIDGGFIILNFDKYRERDYGNSERCKRYRMRKRTKNDIHVEHGDMACQPMYDMQAEEEVEEYNIINNSPPTPPLSAPAVAVVSVKPVKSQKSENPKRALTDAWCSAFQLNFGQPYKFQGARDGKAADDLLRLGLTNERIMEVARAAWTKQANGNSFWSKHSLTLAGFSSRWTEISAEVGMLKGSPTHEDWGFK